MLGIRTITTLCTSRTILGYENRTLNDCMSSVMHGRRYVDALLEASHVLYDKNANFLAFFT